MTHDELKARYPLFLRGVSLDVGAGWLRLLDDLCGKIAATGAGIQVRQVKEKYGGLRFYVDRSTPEIYALIEAAEMASFHVCQDCGAPGVRTQLAGWTATLCPACFGQRRRHAG